MITARTVNPGRLDKRITLLYPLLERSASGQAQEVFYEGATVWAEWVPQGSREFMAAAARHAETTGLLRIRHRADLGAAWRIRLGSDEFKLTGDPIELGRREYLELPVAIVNRQAAVSPSVRLLHETGGARLLHDGTPALLHTAA